MFATSRVANASYSQDTLGKVASDSHLRVPLLSDEVTLILQWIIYNIVCQSIDLLGIGTNVINIVCFVKQGFKETTNVNLLGK